ncbi:MAG TPA: hypothetical protein VHT05_06010 [Candidatus Elarobacter sp.]|jgi:hypothetical protein|nr:hypothetical protein [Candidatus Elarobacter sp.]
MRPTQPRKFLLHVALTAFVVTAGLTATADSQDRGGAAAGAAVAPAPAAKTPDPTIRFAHPVVFVLSLGTDIATSARITTALAARLRAKDRTDPKLPVKNAWLVPEGGWTLADYLQQCARDPNTQGAFIVLPPSTAQSNLNWIVLLETRTQAQFSVMVAACDHAATASSAAAGSAAEPVPMVSPGANTQVVWASDPVAGTAGRSQVEIFPLSILTSIYLAFAPQRQYQTVTTQVYPTTLPLPAGGERTQVATTNQTTLNGQGAGSIQNGIVTAFAGSNGGGLGSTIGSGAGVDWHLLHAADDALGHLLNDQLDPFCRAQPPGTGPYDAHAFCAW